MAIEGNNKVLVVAADGQVVETVVTAVAHCSDAHITCTSTGNSAKELDDVERHDLVVIGQALQDATPAGLAADLLEMHNRPIIVVGGRPDARQVIELMRIGVSDVVPAPIDETRLAESVREGLQRAEADSGREREFERLRSLVRNVLRNRRDLNQRFDVICRDVSGAYRRLFHRVVSPHERAATDR